MAYQQRPPPPRVAAAGHSGGRPPPPRDNRYPNQTQRGYYDQGYDDHDGYNQGSRGGYDYSSYNDGQRNGGVYDGNYPPQQAGYDDSSYGPQQDAYDEPVSRPPPLRQAAGKPNQWPLNSSTPSDNQPLDNSFPPGRRRNSGDLDINKRMGAVDINHNAGPMRPPDMRPHTSNTNRPPPAPRQQTAPPSSTRPPPIDETGRRTADPLRGNAQPVPYKDEHLMQPPKRSATMPVNADAAPPSAARPLYPGQSTWQNKTKGNPYGHGDNDNGAADDILDDYFDTPDKSEPDMPNFSAMPNSGAGRSTHGEQLIPGEPPKESSKGAYAAYRPQLDKPLPSPGHGPPPADYYGYPPDDNYNRRPEGNRGRGMPPGRGRGPRGGPRGRGRGRGGYPPRPPPNQHGGPPMHGNDGQRPHPGRSGPPGPPGQPGPNDGYQDPRDKQMGEPSPGPSASSAPQNPDALPQHPAPYRPGLGQGGTSKPPPVRQYDNPPVNQQQAPEGPPPPQMDDGQGPPVVTHQEIQQLQQAVRDKPSDHETQLTLAKKLVEASVHLVDDNGRADVRTKNRNREKYVLDAHKLVKKLVAAGYGEAMFYMADCYGQGLLGLETDPKEAYGLYQSAAKLGHPEAAYRLAVCCEMGHEGGGGTRRDPMKAVQWYRRAAALGDTPAMYKMGMILLKGLLGQQRNPREALSWLKRAAERADEDNPHALHELALLYENPQGNDAVIRDEKYSLDLLVQAGDLGYKFSQFRLGSAYEYGLIGCPVDPRQSIFWYTRAAAQEEHQSELALSGWYLTGAEGILQQSDTEAYLWARKAAIAGIAKAEYAMGYFSEVGIGAPASLDDAKRWYWKASSQNFLKARERLEDLRRGGGKMQRTRVSRSNKQNEGDCVVM